MGGIITNDLWEFDTQTKIWQLVTVKGDSPIAVTGHASVVVLNQMYVIMGYSAQRSFCECIQQLDLGNLLPHYLLNSSLFFSTVSFVLRCKHCMRKSSPVWFRFRPPHT